jgi:hypothetical protein
LLLLSYFQEHYGKDFLKNCEKLKLIPAINIPKIKIEEQKNSTKKFIIGGRELFITQVEKIIHTSHETFIISKYNSLSKSPFNSNGEDEDEVLESESESE